MRYSKGLEFAKELIVYDGLALEISDLLYERDYEDKQLTEREKFLLGLCYSEFLSNNSSDEELYKAEKKRQSYLKLLGINGHDLFIEVESYCRPALKK